MDSTILAAMQFSHIYSKDPINTTGEARARISFQYATTSQPADLPTNSTYYDWTPFTAAEKTVFEEQLAHIETFLNVKFVEVSGSDDPDMNIGKVSIPGSTAGYGGNSISYSGTTITDIDEYAVFDNTYDLSEDAQNNLLLHELGHALGLKHTFGAYPALPSETESNKYSVMSYTANPDNGLKSDAMMLYDVGALQDVWGAAEYNTGNTKYTGSRSNTLDTIWDTGGRDTLDASASKKSVVLDLNEGEFSRFGSYDDVVIAFGVKIENATGGKAGDRIYGNDYANKLVGGGGRDKVFGGAGNDKAIGGFGNDKLFGGSGKDRLDGGRGNDDMTGNKGRDKFVFKLGSGNDTVKDFQDDVDKIIFQKLGNLSDVLDHASKSGGNVVFDFGDGDTFTILNTTIAQLSGDILT